MAPLKPMLITGGVIIVLGALAGIITWSVLRSKSTETNNPDVKWWQHCVLYQIYPRSFKDSDGDGIGDLNGIKERLEHFVEAGVDAIWLSPIFTSPMVDFGYDISNYYDIHYEYGTMADFDALLENAHQLGLKVILDFVPNHASTESEYFRNSVQRVAGYEDFFIWDDGIEDSEQPGVRLPPSNWVSQFGGSTWEFNEERQQFYLHQFAIEQADFNFRNQAVLDEMINIMRFWLNKGVDGFRIDALPYMFEARKEDHGGFYPDDPLSGYIYYEPGDLGYTIPIYSKDLIELYDVVYDWRDFIDAYSMETESERAIFTEGYANISMTMLYYGNDDDRIGAHFPFNFDFITELDKESNARDFVYVVLHWLTYMPNGCVANWVFGNHDRNRMATRFREDMVDGLNALDIMLPGVSITYQGEEIGMTDGEVSWEETVDIQACNMGDPDTYHLWSRDPARTPFHWDNSTSAGFSTNESTWLPVASNYQTLNVENQKNTQRSHFNVFKSLTALKKSPTLKYGSYDIKALSSKTLMLKRISESRFTYTLLFNVANESDTVSIVEHNAPTQAKVHISSIHSSRESGDMIDTTGLTLQPGEALILSYYL